MDWFKMWYDDKCWILNIMADNMASDLKAGYDYFGKSIQQQIADINAYKEKFDKELMSFADMDEKKRDRWCYYDMVRRGAIEP